MSDEVLGALLLATVILPMVGLAVAAVQPSWGNVVRAAIALAVLPALIVVVMLVVWLIGR